MAKLTKLLTGLLILSLCFMGLTTFLGDLGAKYDIVIDSKYTDTYIKMNNTNAELQNMSTNFEDRVEGEELEEGAFGWLDVIGKNAWLAVKSTTRSVGLAGEMVDTADNIPGVQDVPYISAGLKTIIILAITLALLGIMLKREL